MTSVRLSVLFMAISALASIAPKQAHAVIVASTPWPTHRTKVFVGSNVVGDTYITRCSLDNPALSSQQHIGNSSVLFDNVHVEGGNLNDRITVLATSHADPCAGGLSAGPINGNKHLDLFGFGGSDLLMIAAIGGDNFGYGMCGNDQIISVRLTL